jgi:hypothetical protein
MNLPVALRMARDVGFASTFPTGGRHLFIMNNLLGSRVADDELIEKLEQWKKEAMTVFDDLKLQEIGKELDLPLGIAREILPWIRNMKNQKRLWALTYEYFDKVYGRST